MRPRVALGDPTIGGGESIDPVASARIHPVAHGKKDFDFQALEPAIDRLPALPPIARTKDPPTEGSGIDRTVFPRGERQNERIGHTLARFRPGGATILAAKETKAERAGIDQIVPDRRESLNARGLLTGGIVLRLNFPMAWALLRSGKD